MEVNSHPCSNLDEGGGDTANSLQPSPHTADPAHCPTYANLMQSVTALTVCLQGATRTPSPAVQAAHLALSLPYALKLASTPLGVIPVPLSVGVGHPRRSSNRVQVVAVPARRCSLCLTRCFPRRASEQNSFGQKNGTRHGDTKRDRA